ncbi:MAG: hypothetical protein ACRYGK_00195 [Janthinobacterium lividum]
MAKQNHITTKAAPQIPPRNVENSSTNVASDDSKAAAPALRTYSLPDYGSVTVDHGRANDFASRRAEQLYSLLMITHGDGDFHTWSSDIKDGILDLAANLAHELIHLIPLVRADAAAFALRGTR